MFALAVDAALAAVQTDALCESAHRALIDAHLAAGNRIGALRSYGRLQSVLSRELGIAPSDELRREMAAVTGDLPAPGGPRPPRASGRDPSRRA